MVLTKAERPLPQREIEYRNNPLQLAILISNKGTGSNLQAVIDTIHRKELHAQIGLVVSDKPDTHGIVRAQKNDLPYIKKYLLDRKSPTARDAYGRELGVCFNELGIDVAVLAGFMTILSDAYFDTFKGKTINIHPGLLPYHDGTPYKFPDGTIAPWNQGKMTDDAVGSFLGLRYAGSTVHEVVKGTIDNGPVLERVIIPTKPDDTTESLYAKLKIKEHEALIRSLQKLSKR